jgi:tetratricopeptide (TPR) repeat protein
VILALGQDLLASAPRGATLVVPDTDPTFALLYLQAVEEERPDVTAWVLTSGKLKPLRRAVDPDLEPLTLAQLVKQVNGPVCTYERIPSDALAVWQSQPLGVLYQLHRKGEPAPAVEPRRCELEAYVDPLPAFALDEATRIVLAGYSIGMGDRELALGRTDAGRARYRVAAEVGGEVAAVQRELGRRYADLGEAAAAVEWLEKSIAARDDGLARNRLGRVFVGEQRLEEALAAFTRAVELEPDNAIFHSNRGGCLAMLARTEEALAEFETAVRLDPASLMARNNLARALQLTGERERSIAEWRASLALDPTQEEVRRTLAELGERP